MLAFFIPFLLLNFIFIYKFKVSKLIPCSGWKGVHLNYSVAKYTSPYCMTTRSSHVITCLPHVYLMPGTKVQHFVSSFIANERISCIRFYIIMTGLHAPYRSTCTNTTEGALNIIVHHNTLLHLIARFCHAHLYM